MRRRFTVEVGGSLPLESDLEQKSPCQLNDHDFKSGRPMNARSATNGGGNFVTSLLPWLLAAVMLVVYLLTLNHWVTPGSLDRFTDLSGWNWRPRLVQPVTFLVTYPLRWLPAGLLPPAMSLFAAVCAALTLGLLARSVALLPHDRTHAQRLREHSRFALLSVPAAWLPPVFAVMACGLQMTFWENATQETGAMFDVLLFAYVIRCLLEYRISLRDSWLMQFAVVYGLGMANDWAMAGFFPAFLVALVWIKGLGFFNPQFMLRSLGLGLLGFSLILFFPLHIAISHLLNFGFWDALSNTLRGEKTILLGFPRTILLLLSLTSLIPVLFLSIRWSSFSGETSHQGATITAMTFHVVHGLVLVACVLTALDSPLSARRAVPGMPFLSFYYLGALSIGYFSGYFLLIFGAKVSKSWERLHPSVPFVGPCVTALVWLLFLSFPVVMVGKNLPHLEADKSTAGVLDRYCSRIARALPPAGVVVLSDDPLRLAYLRAAMGRTENPANHLFIDTASLAANEVYFHFLEKKQPQFNLSGALPHTTNEVPGELDLIHLLDHLGATHGLYYLHPSFGYYFEKFYMQARGPVYQLKPYATNEWDAPLPTKELVAENQAFWKTFTEEDLPTLVQVLERSANLGKPVGAFGKLLKRAHLTFTPDWLALRMAAYYACALDYWGVELERSGLAKEAGARFDQARQLNSENVAAQVNLEFNESLQTGRPALPPSAKTLEEALGKHSSWVQVLNADGPLDEPAYRYEIMLALTEGRNYRQAVQQLERIEALTPGNIIPRLQLSQLFLYIRSHPTELSAVLPFARCYSNALESAQQALDILPDDPNANFLKSVSLIQMGAYAEAIPPLNRVLSTQTNNIAAELNRAIAYLQIGDLNASRGDYETVANAAPKAYQAYYGLGEIAWRKKDHPGAIKYYRLYLTNAPANTQEARTITQRLKELTAGAP